MARAGGFLGSLLLCAVILFQGAPGIQLTVRIPTQTVRGQSARLECNYDMEGSDLYAVKWFKDRREFYRYVPLDRPPVKTFNQKGVTLDLQNSTEGTVILSSVDLSSAGRYHCEVSAGAPSFHTEAGNGDMVVVEPDQTTLVSNDSFIDA